MNKGNATTERGSIMEKHRSLIVKAGAMLLLSWLIILVITANPVRVQKDQIEVFLTHLNVDGPVLIAYKVVNRHGDRWGDGDDAIFYSQLDGKLIHVRVEHKDGSMFAALTEGENRISGYWQKWQDRFLSVREEAMAPRVPLKQTK
jgi:hypothetical protein